MKKEIKYSKRHMNKVSARLRQYEEVIASTEFEQLDNCRICETVPKMRGDFYSDCAKCMLGYGCDPNDFSDNCGDPPCFGPNGIGEMCYTKAEQKEQFKHLIKRIGKAGYEFK